MRQTTIIIIITPLKKTAYAALYLSVLFQAGCENLSATENGLLAAGLAGAATGIAMGTTGVPAGSTIPIAIGAAAGAGALAAGASNYQTSRERRGFTEQQGQALVMEARSKGYKSIPRYILVDTVTTAPKQGRAVMIFDTVEGRVSSDRVYYTTTVPGPYGLTPSPYGAGR